MKPRSVFKQLLWFNENEKWGDPYAMDAGFLFLIDALRSSFDKHHYWRIHCAADIDGHADGSEHYHRPCSVIDFHIANISVPEASKRLLMELRKRGLSDEVSLGIYPIWSNPGFHFAWTGSRKRWGFIHNRDKKRELVSYSEALKLFT